MSKPWESLGWGVYNDIHQALPVAARYLSEAAATVKVNDLVVLAKSVAPRRYMFVPEHQDEPVKMYGLVDGFPFIAREVKKTGKPYSGRAIGDGLTLYRCRGKKGDKQRGIKPLKYILLTTRNPDNYGGQVAYVITTQKDREALIKYFVKAEQRATKGQSPPLLSPGLLERIIENTIGYLREAKEIGAYGVKIKRGVILDGKPGNGKTMVCKWLRKLCMKEGYSFRVITSGEIDSYYSSGDGLEGLLNLAQVAIFDDIDISYMSRSHGEGKKACAILAAMDGVEDEEHRIRVFTTNEDVESLDEAFFRPGRIDERFTLDRPNKELREKLVLNYWPEEIQKYLSDGLMDQFLSDTKGYSFSDIEYIRSALVLNKVTGDGKWDLDKAFAEFNRRNAKKEKKGVGFACSLKLSEEES